MVACHATRAHPARLPDHPEQGVTLLGFEAKQQDHRPANEAGLRFPPSSRQPFQLPILVVAQKNLDPSHRVV